MFLVLAGIVLLGCDFSPTVPHASMPTEQRVAEIVGVVASRESHPPDSTIYYHLTDGRVVPIDNEYHEVGRAYPHDGDLMLAGRDSEGRWWSSFDPRTDPANCWQVLTVGVDSGPWIDTAIGLRFSKARQFTSTPNAGGRYEAPGGFFCLNSSGEVTSFQDH